MIEITSLAELSRELADLPEGTTCDVLASDLEAGNFETAHFVLHDDLHAGMQIDISYSGPVAEGYVSPFEAGEESEAPIRFITADWSHLAE